MKVEVVINSESNNQIETNNVESHNEMVKCNIDPEHNQQTEPQSGNYDNIRSKDIITNAFEKFLINNFGFSKEDGILYKHYRWLKIVLGPDRKVFLSVFGVGILWASVFIYFTGKYFPNYLLISLFIY